MRNLGTRVCSWKQFLYSLDGCEYHIDGDIAVGVTIDLDSRPVHAFDPRIESVLGLRDITFVCGQDAGIRSAERHGPFRKRTVNCVLGCGSKPNPLVAEASRNTAADHRFENI